MSQAFFVASPIGAIRIECEARHLTGLTIGLPPTDGDDAGPLPPPPLLIEAAAQLQAFFDRRLTRFDLPLAPSRTARGMVLRSAIDDIPFGLSETYGEIAKRIGSGARAIGQACRRNPFPILIPCHRVVGANGTIGHYSAGEGLSTKRLLLAHEAR